MTKSDLRTGMAVVDRSGRKWFVLKESYVKVGGSYLEGSFIVSKDGHWCVLDSFNEDLTMSNCREMDIVAVLMFEKIQDLVKSGNSEVVIWKRKDPPKKLTLSELEAILGYEVEIVDGKHSKGQSCTNNFSKTIDK